MHGNYLIYLEDILSSTNKIMKYVGDAAYKDILLDEMRLEAIIRNFEIIGEASCKTPHDIKARYLTADAEAQMVRQAHYDNSCCLSKLALSS
ncbi:MAG: hypothetical protein HZA00_03285 [Nitrospinae bacterium]|nr:hypothetical protein [Nitrospinota bacterium]